MGLGCSKKQLHGEEEASGPLVVRLSPFRPRRCLSRSRSLAAAIEGTGEGPEALLIVALDTLARSLHQQSARALARLAPDLSQLLLERLVAAGTLDDGAVAKLSGLGLHFYRLPLAACPDPVRPFWLRCLATTSLQEADLSKTEAADEALACLGPTPSLTRLSLDYCVDLSDAGLAMLKGCTALEELSLACCELLTAVGLDHLRGLTSMRRLCLQMCHQVSLAPLTTLRQLESLDVGWCGALGDADAAVLACYPRLTHLSLARTQVSDRGLAQLQGLTALRDLSLAGLRVSDEGLAALLARLPLLRTLSLERCQLAGDKALGALGQHARELRELALGYTGVTDGGLQHLSSLTRLEVLSLENCGVGNRGLAVLSALCLMRKLDLSDTAAGNESMMAVGSMKRLECLNLSFTAVNDLGLRCLRRLPALRCLNLDSRLFTDAGMASVAHLTGLECLDLFGARVGDIGCAALSKMRQLRHLEVCGGGVTDGGVAHLAALPKLQHLSLAQNYRITNACVSHILKLNELTALNLSQCRITSNSVVALGCLAKLQTLALHETRVKPFAVDKLLAANPDLTVQGVKGTAAASGVRQGS